MRLAIVAEKPSLLQSFSKVLPEFYPEVDFTRTPVCYPMWGWYSGTAHRYRLRRGLRMSELPQVSETAYRPLSFEESGGHIGVRWLGGEGRIPSTLEAARAYDEADVILVLVDPSYAGAELAERFLTSLIGSVPTGKVLYPRCSSLTDQGLRSAMSNARLWEDFADRIAGQGRIRRFFDFNYLNNALAILAPAAVSAGLGRRTLSKYELQFLYHARGGRERHEGVWMERMTNWTGTGRYGSENEGSFGSAASRYPILSGLLKDGFLRPTSTGRRDSPISISTAGEKFLTLLHPDCEDKDLPFRIWDWSKLPEPEAKEKIGRYIRTYFGKQKRFMKRWEIVDASE
jgi:hypothetical protein